MGGQIGGKTDDYWQKARSLAQQQLYLNPDMEGQVRQQIDAGNLEKDPAFSKMMGYVEKGCRNKTHNPYHQARRNEYAVENGLLHKIQGVGIVLVLDQSDNIILFQGTNVFDQLLTKAVQKHTVQSFEAHPRVPKHDGSGKTALGRGPRAALGRRDAIELAKDSEQRIGSAVWRIRLGRLHSEPPHTTTSTHHQAGNRPDVGGPGICGSDTRFISGGGGDRPA